MFCVSVGDVTRAVLHSTQAFLSLFFQLQFGEIAALATIVWACGNPQDLVTWDAGVYSPHSQ